MKKYIVLIVLSFSCSTIKKSEKSQGSPCNENLEFKTEFFKNVKTVEDYFKIESTTAFENLKEYENIMTDEKKKSYEFSLEFISRYSHVSFESMLNYDRSYPIGVFEEDRAGWLKWYEENKCKNIQFN